MSHSTSALSSFAVSVSDVFSSALSVLIGLLNMGVALARDLISGLFHILAGAFQGVFAVIHHVSGAALDVVTGVVRALFDLVGGVVGFVAANIVLLSMLSLAYYIYTQRSRSQSSRKTH